MKVTHIQKKNKTNVISLDNREVDGKFHTFELTMKQENFVKYEISREI